MTSARLAVEPMFQGTDSVVWAADGTPMLSFSETASADDGSYGSIQLPVVDQNGWLDAGQNAYKLWGYKLTETPSYGRNPGKQRVKYWQPLTGQTTVDFDRIPDGSLGLPSSGPIAVVTSVNGQTGAVTVTGGGGGGAVASVNGQTGTVVLTADNITDGTTNKAYTSTERAKLAGIAPAATANRTDSATDTAIQTAVNNLVNGAPGALDQLNELAAALGNDANFAATVTNSLAGKVPATRTVAGKPLSADITLTKTDVGLANVDNTADTAKPISVLQQAALDQKPNLKRTSRAQKIASAIQTFDLARAMWPVMNQQVLPAIGASAANAATTISGGVTTTITQTGPFTITGATALRNDASGTNGFIGPANDGAETATTWWQWVTDAPTIELVYLGISSPTGRIIIDGESTSVGMVTYTGSSGAPHRLKIANGSRKWRTYLLESSGLWLSSVTVGPLDTLLPAPAAPAKLAWMGDSYSVNNNMEIPLTAARILGMTPTVNAEGGTGYNNAGSGNGKSVFLSRLPGLLNTNPDALVVLGGINDGTTTLQTDCASFIQAARSTISDLPIVIIGSQNPPSAGGSAATKSALLKAAAAAKSAAYVDPVTGNVYDASGAQVVAGTPWSTGTGSVQAPAGTGNADLYIGTSDTTHPYPGTAANSYTDSGFVYWGIRAAEALRTALTVAA